MRMKFQKICVIVGVVLIALLVIIALFASYLTKYDPDLVNNEKRLSPPSKQYPFGTDNLGRDIETRLFYGLRTSLLVSTIAVIVAMIHGGLWGLVGALLERYNGKFGKEFNKAVILYARFLSAGPGVLLTLAIASRKVGSTGYFAIAVSFALVPGFIRVIGGVIMRIKDSPKNVVMAIIAQISLSLALALLLSAAISFIGFGTQRPALDLGVLVSEGRNFIREFTHLIVYPGLALFITALAFNVLGESLTATLFLKESGDNNLEGSKNS